MNREDIAKIKSKYPTDRLGPGSLLTDAAHTSGVRLNMSNSQIRHVVNIANPDVAKVTTGFEAVIGQFSNMVKKVDADEEVIYRIDKNKYNFILITYSKKLNRYNIIRREEIERHSEGFCSRYKNKVLDNIIVGDIIEDNTIVSKSEAFDKHMNYRLGKNLNTLHMITVDCLEDQIVLMNNAENMMDTYMYDKITININNNDVLLNLYGDNDEYLPLPKIGKHTHKGIITALRTITTQSSIFNLSKDNLKKMMYGDKIFYGEGRIIDIDIYYNKDISKLQDDNSNKYLNDLFINQMNYYRMIYEILRPIIDNAKQEGHSYTDDLTILYKEAVNYLDAKTFFDKDGIFNNMLIEVTVLRRESLIDGSKMVGRSGNKGVCKIAGPDEWYVTESGRPIHAVVSGLSVVARLNSSVLIEHGINATSITAEETIDKVLGSMDKKETISEKFNILHNYVSILNQEEANHLKKVWKMLNHNERVIFIKKVISGGIHIVQDPVESGDLYNFKEAHEQYPPKYEKIVFPDGTKSLKSAIVAPQYFYRLKQDPIDKFAARSRGMISPLYLLPTKSSLKKHKLSPYSDIAVRIGEYEIDVLMLCNEEAAISDYMAIHSTSTSAKETLIDSYLDADLDTDKIDVSTKKNKELLDAYLEVLGSEIKFTYKEEEDINEQGHEEINEES